MAEAPDERSTSPGLGPTGPGPTALDLDDPRARAIVPGPVGRLLMHGYLSVLARRNRAFDRGEGVWRAPLPVISVGNLSVGGTGKTPTVARLCGMLVRLGRRPCVLMRGYKAKRGGLSDEEAYYRRTLGGVPVVAQPDRRRGLESLLASPSGEGIDAVVLDDGFQHRRIARDLDLLLVDATHDLARDRPLPAGWLREPVESMARADAVVLTHAESVSPGSLARTRAFVDRFHGSPPVAESEHRWSGLLEREPGGRDDVAREPAWLSGKRAVVVCGVGRPVPFQRACEHALGGPPAHALILRDHDPYAPATVRRLLKLADDAEVIITTEKDWSKLGELDGRVWPCPLARPQLEIGFRDVGADGVGDADAGGGEARIESLVRRALERPGRPASTNERAGR